MSTPGIPAPGDSLGPYQVGRRLGGGGMGVVFEALDTQLQRQVALKVISPHLADDPAFRERFVREARGQASLDSPHVVSVHAFGEQDGRLYIASQLVPDGDLRALLEQYGAPPLDVALDLIGQVASGLADAHEAGLAHRDIKPANVLLRRRGSDWHAYLADFGIARQVGVEQQLTNTAVGTPSYMAPELHTGSAPGLASDVYSLGCVLWATLTGAAPYAGTTDFQVVSAHLEDPIPQLPPGGPREAEVNRVLRTALAKNPADRYPTAAAMRDDLRRVRAMPAGPPPRGSRPGGPPTGPLTPRPVGPPSGPARSGRRVGLIAAAVVVLLAAAGAGTAYALTRDGDEPKQASAESSASEDPTPSEEPTPSPTPTPTPTPSPTPTPTTEAPATDGGGRSGPEKRAIKEFTDQLLATGAANEEDSRCISAALVDDIGFDEMVEMGLFTAEGKLLPAGIVSNPDMVQQITDAAVGCLMPS
ncbi:serine/threonine-protein kinase [Nocardioides lianchengensis]|uniref:non-specific serine/threonine protein kinase n=1 Tax=Nocardioides lianchengensis TaxID=1045774 RepID=A0A1G6KYS4_9ACTN|nr:serine/threonine-protein kinase [Nocardioides lianchengensis]NYG13731.1 serine/threonine-protein kinase [Nocardioides lianchengensis]SDC35635.1 serine/threonine protein kinase [Nocardioides lianchengensis]